MGSTRQATYKPAKVVGPACAQELICRGALVLDVREPREWLAGHIRGSLQLPLGRITSGAAGLSRDRTVVVVCRSGRRSARAAAQLVSEGFPAVNLLGGLQVWHLCLPLDGQDDRPGWVA